jgi:hypothetical protein
VKVLRELRMNLKFRAVKAALPLLGLAMSAWPLGVMAQAVAPAPGTGPTPAGGTSNSPAASTTTSDTAYLNTPITVQIAPPPIATALLGVSAPLGAQAAPGKPMYAEFITEHHQSFTDGNRISRSTTSCIYRDIQGRIRRESQLSVPGLPASVLSATFITIVDHQLGYGFVLDPQEMIAHRYELNGSGPSYVAQVSAKGRENALLSPSASQQIVNGSTAPASTSTNGTSTNAAGTADAPRWKLKVLFGQHRMAAQSAAADAGASGTVAPGQLGSGFLSEGSGSAAAPTMRINQPFLAAPNPVRTENLGEQTILGFHARGTRVITTLPAGQIGNDRPIDIVSEQWFSPELDLVMRSSHRDPWGGEFTTTVTRISRGDQPSALFEVPAPYKIIDAASEHEHHILDGRGSHTSGQAPW